MMSLQQSLLSGNRSTTTGTLGIKNINRYIHNSKALSLRVYSLSLLYAFMVLLTSLSVFAYLFFSDYNVIYT